MLHTDLLVYFGGFLSSLVVVYPLKYAYAIRAGADFKGYSNTPQAGIVKVNTAHGVRLTCHYRRLFSSSRNVS